MLCFGFVGRDAYMKDLVYQQSRLSDKSGGLARTCLSSLSGLLVNSYYCLYFPVSEMHPIHNNLNNPRPGIEAGADWPGWIGGDHHPGPHIILEIATHGLATTYGPFQSHNATPEKRCQSAPG